MRTMVAKRSKDVGIDSYASGRGVINSSASSHDFPTSYTRNVQPNVLDVLDARVLEYMADNTLIGDLFVRRHASLVVQLAAEIVLER